MAARRPIVAGGLMWLSDAARVAAGARVGTVSSITAASLPESAALRREIRARREAADGAAFGVDVSMLPKLVPGEKLDDTFRLIGGGIGAGGRRVAALARLRPAPCRGTSDGPPTRSSSGPSSEPVPPPPKASPR